MLAVNRTSIAAVIVGCILLVAALAAYDWRAAVIGVAVGLIVVGVANVDVAP